MSAVAHMHGVTALAGRVAVLSLAIGVVGGRVGGVTLSGYRAWRAICIVDIGNSRLDRKQGEAERDEAGRQPVKQGSTHGRYLNPMIRALKAVSVRSCVLGFACAAAVGACRGEAERAGEPIAHRRLRVDTASPPPALIGAMLRLGDSVFHGQVGNAPCSRCHGQSDAGAPSGPELRQSQWLRAAPYGAVVHFLAHGQRDARGEDAGAPHPGAAQLSAAELRAVALYADSLARGGQAPAAEKRP